MRLLLVRHAASLHSRARLLASPTGCPGLTPEGTTAAHTLAARVGQSWPRPGVLLCSTALRARQTAEILAPALQVSDIDCRRELCEIYPGEADGMTWPDYESQFGSFDLVENPDRPFSPGGESWNEFLARVRGLLHEFAQRYTGQTVVAVTHAGFMVASMLVLFDIPRPGTGARLEPDYLSVMEWAFTGDQWHLVRFGDA